MGDQSNLAVENPAAAILAASPDCVKVLSSDGILRFINDCGLELMEVDSVEQVRGMRYADLWPSDMRQQVTDAINGAAAGETTRVEGYCATLKGTPRWWEVHFHRVRSSPDVDIEVIGVTRDISARRARELVLHDNEKRFALFVEASRNGICEISDGHCTFINTAGARILGYTSDELLGKDWHSAIHHHRADGSAYPREECPIFKATLTGLPSRVTDEVFWHKNGHPVPTSISVYPVKSEYRKSGVVVTFNDGTEQKRIRDDLRRMAGELSEAERHRTEFIATLAHELRNPLAPIRTGLQLMRKAGDNAVAVGHVREMMERQVTHMVHLIGDLLDIARVTSGKMELKKERIELRRVIETALEASASLIANAQHSLTVQVPPEPMYIDGDPTRLAQIFTNILNNAAKYTAAGGSISLCAARADKSVTVDITDSGIGIAPHALGSVFEMFTTVGRNVAGAQGGLGIGLNLVRRLVQLHGGSVNASSGGVGCGSRFEVTLPLASPEARYWESTTAPAADTALQPSRVKVLLVDDNVDAAASLSLLLEIEDHCARVANSGAEALRVVGEFKPDIVFLDIGMPGMNGYEVARAIRAMPDVGSPVLVALTGWGGEADRTQSKNAGFDEHLTKPADIRAIEKLLEKLEQRAP